MSRGLAFAKYHDVRPDGPCELDAQLGRSHQGLDESSRSQLARRVAPVDTRAQAEMET